MALLTLTAEWKRLPGFVHGLPQRALLGGVQLRAFQSSDSAALACCMDALLPHAQPTETAAHMALGFVQRLLWWCGAVQRHARLAVCTQVYARPLPQHDPMASSAAQVEPNGEAVLSFAVALPYSAAEAALATLKLLCKLVNALHGHAPGQAAPAHAAAQLRQHLEQLKPHGEPGLNLLHLLQAAFRLGVPVNRVANRIYRLGHGANARLMDSTVSDRTPALGMAVAQDKWLCARMLRAVGLPATDNHRASSADEAVALAQRLGYPVVVKPADRDQGKGVSTRLTSDEAVRVAWQAARDFSTRTLVERFVPGWGYRITVHDDQIVAMLRRIPGGVTGDGSSSIAMLVASAADEADARGQRHQGRVSLDDEALALLAEQELVPESVVAAGRFVALRQRDNISAGGRLEHLDPTTAHPDNQQAALRAAKALHLDLAGVDFLSPDITRSWREVGGAICEVNARPQFGAGLQGDNYDRVLRRLLGNAARIPTQLLLVPVGPEDAAPTLAALHTLRAQHGLHALSAGSQVWLHSEAGTTQLLASDMEGAFASARAALADREVNSLLMVLTPEELLQHGLPVDRVDAVHLWGQAWPSNSLRLRDQALALCEGALLSPTSPPTLPPTSVATRV